MKGKIVKYFSRRGFGFIAPEGSQDEIFFHVSNYPETLQPEIGVEVEFEQIDTPKGQEAKNLKVLAAEAEEEEAEAPEEEEAAVEEEVSEEEAPAASGKGVGDIKGVGKATEEKLVGAGFETVESIAAVDAAAVSEKAGISEKVAAKIVASAKELLE